MQEGDCLWSELRSRGAQGSPLLVNRGNGGGSSSQCGVVTARKTKGIGCKLFLHVQPCVFVCCFPAAIRRACIQCLVKRKKNQCLLIKRNSKGNTEWYCETP